MVWQDIVMMIMNLVFALSLIPQVYHGFKEKRGLIKIETSAPTFMGLYAVAFSLYTLSLFFSAISATITGTFWFILFVQRLIYREA